MSILSTAALLLLLATSSWLATRFLINYLTQNDIVDRPNDRTLHQGAIPRGGGLAIIGSAVAAMIGIAVYSDRLNLFLSLALLTTLWASLSWWDDRADLSPRRRFGIQTILAITTILAYGWVVDIQVAESSWLIINWLGWPLTVLGVLWSANLYNFMDGMDGMAAAQTIIAAVTLSFWFFQANDPHLSFVCAALAAASYGFLLWNWQPAKIFMGDVGSVSIGALFATLIILGVTRYEFSVLSCGMLFALFFTDTSLTLLRRLWRREKFWLAHRSHFYQRLAALDIRHSTIVLGATILMLLCSLIATASMLYRDIILPALASVIALLGLVIVLVVYLERVNKNS